MASRNALILSILLPLLVAGVWAECPAPADLKNADGTKVCAKLYTDDNPYYNKCCAGNVLLVPPEEDQPYMPSAFNNKVSSLVVAQKCQLTVWSSKGKGGNTRTFKTGSFPRLQECRRGLFSNWDNTISAYYCKCT